MFEFLTRKSSSYLGVDIGTSSIKVVQLKLEDNKAKLETYGFLENYESFELSDNATTRTTKLKILDEKIVEVLKKVLKESGVSSKEAVMSVPVFSTFSSIIELPEMSNDEIAKAVPFEARQYIPVPLEEVILDWSIVGKKLSKEPSAGTMTSRFSLQIMLVAVPKEIALKYARIAESAGLELKALEAESFALSRALVGNDKSAIMVVDIGSKNTNISIVDKGFVMVNRGLEVSGNEFTRVVSQGLSVDFNRAEMIKKEIGLEKADAEYKISELMVPALNIISSEILRLINVYFHKNNRRIEQVIVTGGGASLLGLTDFMSKNINIKVSVGNPWARVVYNPQIEPALKEISPFFSVAVGLAMREL